MDLYKKLIYIPKIPVILYLICVVAQSLFLATSAKYV